MLPVGLGALLFFSYVLYPSWVLPIPYPARVLWFISMPLYGALVVWLASRLRAEPPGGAGAERGLFGGVLTPVPLAVLALAVVLHARGLVEALTVRGDEYYHAGYLLALAGALAERTRLPAWLIVRAPLVIVVVAAAAIAWGWRRHGVRIAGAVVAAALPIGLFLAVGHHAYFRDVVRYPPLGRIATLLTYGVFGVHEWSARLPSLVFALLAGIAMMRIVQSRHGDGPAWFALATVLFVPAFFYYSSLAYLESGVLFFILASAFFFLRHVAHGAERDHHLAILLMCVGFFYKQYALPLLPAYVLCQLVRQPRWTDVRGMVRACRPEILGGLTLLPWVLIERLTGVRGVSVEPQNWMSWALMTRIMRNLPDQFTWPVVVLFVGGVLVAAVRHRTVATLLFGTLFALFYVGMTIDNEYMIGYPRFILVLLPSIVFFSALAFATVWAALRAPAARAALLVAAIAALVVQAPLDPARAASRHGVERYVAYAPSFEYLRARASRTSGVASTVPCCDPLAFYAFQTGRAPYGLTNVPLPLLQTPDVGGLARWARENRIEYILVVTAAHFSAADMARWAGPDVPDWEPASYPLVDRLARGPLTDGLSLEHDSTTRNGRVLVLRVS